MRRDRDALSLALALLCLYAAYALMLWLYCDMRGCAW